MAGRLPLLPLPDCVWPMIAGGVFWPAANSSQGPEGAYGAEAQSWAPLVLDGWLLRTFIHSQHTNTHRPFHRRTIDESFIENRPLFSTGAEHERLPPSATLNLLGMRRI